MTAVELRENQLRLGLWMFLATVTMLFAAFASAYIVRRSGSDWQHVALPPALWINTLVLAASSVALETANRFGQRRAWESAGTWCAIALGGGVAFLGGQLLAWQEMVAAGVYLPSSPHSSFFYMITGAHALHVAAALCVLAWGLARTKRAERDPRSWPAAFELCRTFWHYLGLVWIALFALMTFL